MLALLVIDMAIIYAIQNYFYSSAKQYLVSKINAVRMANKPNKNKITAITIFKAFSRTFVSLLIANAMITEPPNNNKIDNISWSQTYLLNKLFI